MISARLRTLLVVGGSLLVGGFLLGYLPERSRRIDAESAAAARGADLEAAQRRLRIAGLLGGVLMTRDLAARSDFGQAQQSATTLFDAVRAEAQTPRTDASPDLEAVLAGRDAVTAALAKSDPSVGALLADAERRLRSALGYAVPATLGTEPR